MYLQWTPGQPPPISSRVHVVLWIWIFAYIGVAVRIGLGELTTTLERTQARPSILTDLGRSFFLANVVGCFFMGMCQPLKVKYTQFDAVWTGITTGFCGCCTTFASWELFTAHQYLTHLAVNATFVFFVQLMCCFGSHWGGEFIGSKICEEQRQSPAVLASQLRATALARSLQTDAKWQVVVEALDTLLEPHEEGEVDFVATPSKLVWLMPRLSLAAFACGTALVTIAVIIHLPTWSALWIAPFGALARYELGKRLNSSTLPFGTLAANVVASAVDCVVLLWLREPEWAQAAIVHGFCGSLSTVSSWVNELNGMATKQAVVYAGLTHGIALGVSLAIFGGLEQAMPLSV
ncbi:hypothetical protein, variant [Aphanomyces invadans]|uniref:Fluoride ion transporter CrcB n=1 Tax=Aphanomyces invadans TaxID=157072 RepID=A0A024TEI5_9STRA|nr:hypothetical protein, variant [Aphanomyces invadans]ETV91772.1 hypothetical protein, variant [Aphanomyces invadans]|eukprot:XP_008879698.1 hypothetical protein, variant [Aphanomyces invadans]